MSWHEAGVFDALGVLLDPVRLPYIVGAVRAELGPGLHRTLDLGTGGGSLAEGLASAGLSVVGLDPSLPPSARALHNGMGAFVGGYGEQLPFADGAFDVVVCMEVLEHVENAAAVVAEAGRVLRPGGVFVFSGPNRTVINRLGLVFIAQDVLGLIPRGTHDWARLLRPEDMRRLLRASSIEPVHTAGVGLRLRNTPVAVLAGLGLLTRHLTYPEAARRIDLETTRRQSVAYQGYGIRRQGQRIRQRDPRQPQ